MLSKAGGKRVGANWGNVWENLMKHRTHRFPGEKKIENALMCGRVKRESFENTDGIFKNCFPVQNHRKLIKDIHFQMKN